METREPTCNAVIIVCPRCGKGYHHTPVNAALCLQDQNPHYPRAWPRDGICPCGRELPLPPAILPSGSIPGCGSEADIIEFVANAVSVATASANRPGLTIRKRDSIHQLARRLSRISACLEAGVVDSHDLDGLVEAAAVAMGCIPASQQQSDGDPDWAVPSQDEGAKLATVREFVRQVREMSLPDAPALAPDGRLADWDDAAGPVLPSDDDDGFEPLGPEPYWRRCFDGGATRPLFIRLDDESQPHHVEAAGFNLWDAYGPDHNSRHGTEIAAMAAADAVINKNTRGSNA